MVDVHFIPSLHNTPRDQLEGRNRMSPCRQRLMSKMKLLLEMCIGGLSAVPRSFCYLLILSSLGFLPHRNDNQFNPHNHSALIIKLAPPPFLGKWKQGSVISCLLLFVKQDVRFVAKVRACHFNFALGSPQKISLHVQAAGRPFVNL